MLTLDQASYNALLRIKGDIFSVLQSLNPMFTASMEKRTTRVFLKCCHKKGRKYLRMLKNHLTHRLPTHYYLK